MTHYRCKFAAIFVVLFISVFTSCMQIGRMDIKVGAVSPTNILTQINTTKQDLTDDKSKFKNTVTLTVAKNKKEIGTTKAESFYRIENLFDDQNDNSDSILTTTAKSTETDTAPSTTSTVTTTTIQGYRQNCLSEESGLEYYKSINKDVYARIVVPGTNIDYPILRNCADNNYYLHHNWRRYPSDQGAIYTENYNGMYFDEPVTLVYGHTTDRNNMFTQLHLFEDEAFFNAHKKFYIYLPGEKLIYTIISAILYNNRHIMYSNDFYNGDDLYNFQWDITHPPYDSYNLNYDISLTPESQIVVLSTCVDATPGGNYRYLVSGLLTDVEEID